MKYYLINFKGDDCVVACKLDETNNLLVQHYSNKGYSSNILDPDDLSVGISDIKYSMDEGHFTCSYKRENKKDSAYPNYSDLNDEFYLLIAKGELFLGGKKTE